MKKQLKFSVRYRTKTKKEPRVYCTSAITGKYYGSFPIDHPDAFDRWYLMNEKEIVELKQYISNLKAIEDILGKQALLQPLENYRFSLPSGLMKVIDRVDTLYYRQSIDSDRNSAFMLCENTSFISLNLFTLMIKSMLETMKQFIKKLNDEEEGKAATMLLSSMIMPHNGDDKNETMSPNLYYRPQRNKRKAPNISVFSSNKAQKPYGAFLADEPESFDGWLLMNEKEIIELKHYMNNLIAVKHTFGSVKLNTQTSTRFRLPLGFIRLIEKISSLCYRQAIDFDLYSPLVKIIVETVYKTINNLPEKDKAELMALYQSIKLND